MASLRRSGRRGRRRAPRPAGIVFAGLLTTVVLVGFIWLAENAYNGLPFLSYRTVYASVPNIGHLIAHDPVDIAGVRVGQVLNTETRNNRALAELQLQGVGPLPVNSTVTVRADGLLGARYVQLTPGNSTKMLPNGGTISGGTNTFYDGLPEWLNLFDPTTRSAIGYMLNGLGEGVAGRGTQLNEAIHVGPPSGANFDTTAYAIIDRNNGQAATDFLPDTASGMTALDIARNDIAEMFKPAAVGLQPITQQRTWVDRDISKLVSLEPDADTAFSQANGMTFFRRVIGLSHALAPVLPKVPTALTAATNLLNAASTPVGALPSAADAADLGLSPLKATNLVLDQVPTAAPAALEILGALKPDLAPLHQAFTKLIGPVSSLAEHGCDIQNFATGVRSMVAYGGLPGGNWGPFVGFPISLVISPQEAGEETGLTGSYPTEDYYPAPCAYSPGPTFNDASLLATLSTALPDQ